MTTRLMRLSKWSMLLGNLFEHYDTALFSLLSPFLAPLFFAHQDPLTALIFTYALIPLGMLARPLGSLVFGYLGDNWGRKEALIFSLVGMTLVTACMGLMPTYHQVGFWAPLLLFCGRICQNFFAAGEIAGGAIYLIENSPENASDLTSSFYGASTIAGILLASLGVSLLCLFDSVQEHWRLLYFLGCLTILFACFLRKQGSVYKQKSLPKFSFKNTLEACWKMKKTILTIAIASGFSYASYTLPLVLLNSLVPLISNTTQAEMMQVNTLLLVLDFLLLPFFGFLAHCFSREKMMMLAGILAVVTGVPLFWILPGASFWLIVAVRICLVVIGVGFSAPFYAWSQQLVPATSRYTVISLGYALGTQLLGSPTAAISLWLFQQTNAITTVAWYWMLLGCLSSYLIAKQKSSFEREEVYMIYPKTV